MKKPPLYLLLLLVCIGSVGAVLYTPAMPAIAAYFDLNSKQIALSMTIYLLGYALGQLPYGPLSNHLGRKKTLLIGLWIAICAALISLVAAAIHSYPIFLFSRLLFSIGATAGLQVVYTIVGDLYSPPKSIKVASYLTLTFAIGPSISTTIGGFLTDYFGWQSCFVFLAMYAFFLLILSLSIPETAVFEEKEPLSFKRALHLYSHYFSEKKIFLTGLIIGLAIAFNYSFATLAPTIVISDMGYAPHVYGLMNIMPSISLTLGAFLASFLASKNSYKPLKGIFISIMATIACLVVMLTTSLYDPKNVFLFIIPYAATLFTQPIIETNVLCLALYHHKNKSLTSSVINCLSILMCGLFSLSARLIKTPTSLHLTLIFLILIFFMWLSFAFLNKNMIKESK